MSRHSERKQLRRKSRQRIANRTSNAIMEIYERAKQGGRGFESYLPASESLPPASGDLSFQRIGSRAMGRYYDPAKNGRFKDSRKRTYEVANGTVYRITEV